MINGSLAPHFKMALIDAMKDQPSLAIDGSNDTAVKKMNPMTVRLYDICQGRVVRLYDICQEEL